MRTLNIFDKTTQNMRLNGWKWCLLLVTFGVVGQLKCQAQYEQQVVSALDRLINWYPAYKPASADFQSTYTTQPNSYTSIRDLVGKARAGEKVESVYLSDNILRQGELAELSQLPGVRVLSINGLTTRNADSLVQAIQNWTLLERLTITAYRSSAGGTGLPIPITLPAGLQRLPKLNDIRISDNPIDWPASLPVLTGLKTLRRLELSLNQSTAESLPDFSRLSQLRALKLSGRGGVLPVNVFDGLTQLTELSLSAVNVDAATFSRSLSKLSTLDTLSVENIQSLQQLDLHSLNRLKSLTLSYNPVLVIDAATLGGLSVLERLVIRGVSSVDLSGICSTLKLRTLIINGTGKSVQLPDCIGTLSQLTEFRIENLTTRLPASAGALRQLKKLSLTNCKLDSLPATLSQLTTLEELSLAGNALRQLPALGQLKALRQLSLWNNQLLALPEDIGQLTQLTALLADQNKLTRLPASLTRLTALKTLSLANNQLEKLPDDLGKLRKLQTLMVGNNQLVALPDNLGQLDSLQFLTIGKNRLTTLPASITRLRKLTNLSIGPNELSALPTDFGALQQLTYLAIERIPITELPASIGNLTNLRSLQVTGTRLRLLPDDIGRLTKLQTVALSDNELIALPNSIGQWQNVTNLQIQQNRLDGLPPGIGRLTKLNSLIISDKRDGNGGNFQQLPDSIVYCTQLRNLTIQQQPRLDADDVLTKAARIRNLSNLSLIDCGISQLPAIDWKDVPWQILNLAQNALTELPVAMLDAPKLTTVYARQNRLPEPLDRDFQTKEALRVAFAEAGILPMTTLQKPNRRVANAYQQRAAQKAGRREWVEALADLEKAIDYMPDTTLALPYAQRAEMHFFRKEYTDALADFDRAISYAPKLRTQKFVDTVSISRTLVSFWQRKAAVRGAMRQYDAALADITQAERLLPASDNSPQSGLIYTERGRYLAMKDKLVEADSSYRRAIRAYEKLTYADPGTRLTIVELGLLTGQYDRAQRASTAIPVDQLRGGFATLKEYLDACRALLKGEQTGPQATDRLNAWLAKHPEKVYGWSFDLFDSWLAKDKFPADKAAVLRQLTDATKARLVKPE